MKRAFVLSARRPALATIARSADVAGAVAEFMNEIEEIVTGALKEFESQSDQTIDQSAAAFVREHLKVTPSAVRPLHLARHAIHSVRGVVHSELKRRFEGLRGRRMQRHSSGD